jgi:hypothetical protein
MSTQTLIKRRDEIGYEIARLMDKKDEAGVLALHQEAVKIRDELRSLKWH